MDPQHRHHVTGSSKQHPVLKGLRREEVRAVFVDAEGTLITLVHSIGDVYSRCCRAHGLVVQPQAIDGVLASVWKEHSSHYLNEEDAHATCEQREHELWLRFAETLIRRAAPGAEPNRELLEDIYLAFADKRSRTLRAGAVECVEHLRSSSIITGVLSNNDQRLVLLLADMGIAELFDFVCPTSILGHKKPSRRCFDLVAARVGLEAAQLLYVGDNIDTDYHAARAAGWQSIWFNADDEVVPNEVDAVDSFRRLQEVLLGGDRER